MVKKYKLIIIFSIIGLIIIGLAAAILYLKIVRNLSKEDKGKKNVQQLIERESKIPKNAIKLSPETDLYPPILNSQEYETPIPLTSPLNTAGIEDSPFIKENKLYFFFTPDATTSPNKQLLDEVTGIYVSEFANGAWGKPKRIFLTDPGKLALDGCEFVEGGTMWFCSSREGYEGIHWFTVEYKENNWTNWQNSDFPSKYQIGEIHINNDELYFHSSLSGGKGGTDIWISKKLNGQWQKPENLQTINSDEDEKQPFLTQDGNELWFTRIYKGAPAIYRSKKINRSWQTPELIVYQFAGEPTLDSEGNIYFIHHYFKNGKMIESDIYIAYKK